MDRPSAWYLELWWKVRWSSRATAWMHVIAMYAPFNSWRRMFYRLRGVRIAQTAYVVPGAFLEESRPWLITIEDHVRIGAGVIMATHDAVYHGYDAEIPIRYGKIRICRGATICPGAIIMPGVTVGENAIVAPGALVRSDIPPGVIAAGVPAQQVGTLEAALSRVRLQIPELMATARATKYPWLL